jgi:peroxin-6
VQHKYNLSYDYLCSLRRFHLGSHVNLREIVDNCPLTLTGADFYALCSDALLCAMKDQISLLSGTRTTLSPLTRNSHHIFYPEDASKHHPQQLVVEQRHFALARDRLTPSVSEQELKYYRRVQAQFAQK